MCARFHLKRSSICSRVRCAGAAAAVAGENVSISCRSYFATRRSWKRFRDFFAQDFLVCAGWQRPELEPAEPHTFERRHVMADVGEHPTHLPVLSFTELNKKMRFATGYLSQR